MSPPSASQPSTWIAWLLLCLSSFYFCWCWAPTAPSTCLAAQLLPSRQVDDAEDSQTQRTESWVKTMKSSEDNENGWWNLDSYEYGNDGHQVSIFQALDFQCRSTQHSVRRCCTRFEWMSWMVANFGKEWRFWCLWRVTEWEKNFAIESSARFSSLVTRL